MVFLRNVCNYHIESDRYRRGCCKIWKHKIVLVIYWRQQSHIYSVALVCIRSLGSCLQHYMLVCFTSRLSVSKPFSMLSYTSSFISRPQTTAYLLYRQKKRLHCSYNQLQFTADTISYFSGYPQYQGKFIFYLCQLFFIFPGEVTCSSAIAAATTCDTLLGDKQKALHSSRC